MKQVYCSRECSPYGTIFKSRRQYASDRQKRYRKELKALADEGMTIDQAARVIKLCEITVRVYSRQFNIHFKTQSQYFKDNAKVFANALIEIEKSIEMKVSQTKDETQLVDYQLLLKLIHQTKVNSFQHYVKPTCE